MTHRSEMLEKHFWPPNTLDIAVGLAVGLEVGLLDLFMSSL